MEEEASGKSQLSRQAYTTIGYGLKYKGHTLGLYPRISPNMHQYNDFGACLLHLQECTSLPKNDNEFALLNSNDPYSIFSIDQIKPKESLPNAAESVLILLRTV